MKLTETEIREYAKEDGIEHVGQKKIETIIKELAEKGVEVELTAETAPVETPEAEKPEETAEEKPAEEVEKPETVEATPAPAKTPKVTEAEKQAILGPQTVGKRVLMIMPIPGRVGHRCWVLEEKVDSYRAQGWILSEAVN